MATGAAGSSGVRAKRERREGGAPIAFGELGADPHRLLKVGQRKVQPALLLVESG